MRVDAAEVTLGDRATGLLAELAVHERNAIHRSSQVRVCHAGDVLQRANARSESAVFPITAVLSIVRRLRDGRSIGVGLVGSEGMCGLDVALEMSTHFDDVVVQSAGLVYSMPADDLRHLFEGTTRLQRSIVRFARAFLDQVATNAVCARYHTVAQRLAKWLLMIDDRSGHIVVANATRFGASALAADDEVIDDALSAFMSHGEIAHRRNIVAIRRDGLEVAACECYEAVRIGSEASA